MCAETDTSLQTRRGERHRLQEQGQQFCFIASVHAAEVTWVPSGPMTRCALHIHHKTGSYLNNDDLWLAIPGDYSRFFRFLSFFLYYLDESTGEGEARLRTLVTYIELLSHCRSIPDVVVHIMLSFTFLKNCLPE